MGLRDLMLFDFSARAGRVPSPRHTGTQAGPSGAGRAGGHGHPLLAGGEGRRLAATQATAGRASAGRTRGQAPRERGGLRGAGGVRLPSRGGGCSRSRLYNAGAASPSTPITPAAVAACDRLRSLSSGPGTLHQAERQDAEAGRQHYPALLEPAAP